MAPNMTARQFFQKKNMVGRRIRYGENDAKPVEIRYLNQTAMYAYGTEEGTGRSVRLYLIGGQLKDVDLGRCHNGVELLAR